MKKIFYISLVILSVTSCKDDFIDEMPTTQLPIELAIRNSDDLNKGVVGLYAALQGEQINDLINFSELITDNGLLSNSNNGQYSEIYNMNYTPNSGKITRFWNAFNDVVIKANWVLSFDGKFKTDEGVTNLFAEAKIMRAYARLQLANYFCERYGGANQQLGLVINNNYVATDITTTYPRSTVQETYDAIEEDLLFAIDHMTAENEDNPEFIHTPIEAKAKRMNLLSAYVLMSRVQLYKREWAKAIMYGNVANTLLTGDFEETPRTNPFTIIDNANKSSIFQLLFDASSSLGINSLFSYWGTTGSYRQFYATSEFYEGIPSSDGRRSIYTLAADDIYDDPKPFIAKKFGSNFVYDIVLIRKAEIDFNIIEATYYQNPTQARDLLNSWIKTNRDPSYNSTSTGTAILDDILKQRRIEFAFEGHRFMDLKRNDQGWTKGANYLGSHRQVSINDKEQCLPIPLVEMTVNHKMVQNPGY
ncbi:RagB/SusD family nutrient uptake outer membrane protein [Kaistella sp.]|uniref:RagB/SusD family nutrient uptake outer membrane protein n=1 Tax=Kaistella sp. TaxID=2782235 RepID=UPI003C62B935